MKRQYCCEGIASRFGDIGLIWVSGEEGAGPAVIRILLPVEGVETKAKIRSLFPGVIESPDAVIGPFSRQIGRFLAGDRVDLSLDRLDMRACGAFQQQVLRLEFQIPRGKVSTYGRLADRLGHPRAARAVGTALARNPFPIVIPCHRTIRSDGTLGGFGGGLTMKRSLLEMEGIEFDRRGRVKSKHLWSFTPASAPR